MLVPGAGSVPRLRTLSACENGILFLLAGTPVGEDIKKVLGLDDWVPILRLRPTARTA